MTRPSLLFVGCLACSIVLRLGAFTLTALELATGEAVEVGPIALSFGLYRSLPVSLGTIILPYAVFYELKGKYYYLLLLIIPLLITVFDFVNDLGLAVNLGILG